MALSSVYSPQLESLRLPKSTIFENKRCCCPKTHVFTSLPTYSTAVGFTYSTAVGFYCALRHLARIVAGIVLTLEGFQSWYMLRHQIVVTKMTRPTKHCDFFLHRCGFVHVNWGGYRGFKIVERPEVLGFCTSAPCLLGFVSQV